MSNNKKLSKIDNNLSKGNNRGYVPQVIEFNPLRDVKEVEDGLSVDVDEALQTGIVKDSSASLDNNGIDEPSQVIGLVRDEFAAIDAQRILRKVQKSRSAEKKAQAAAEAAAAVGAPAPDAGAAAPSA